MPRIPRTSKKPSAVLVEKGFLRIDHRRALRKLMDFQWPSGLPLWIPWLRCAVAGGASHLTLRRSSSDSVEARFDGPPLTREDLKDPFGVLFRGEGPVKSRMVHAAQGILTALHLEPSKLTLTSGPPGKRHRLSMDCLESFSVDRASGGEKRTVLSVEYSWFKPSAEQWLYGLDVAEQEAGAVPRAVDLVRMTPIPIDIDGRLVKPLPDDAPEEYVFSRGGVRGRLSVPAYLKPDESRLSLSVHGIRFGQAKVRPSVAKVAGELNCDALKLDLSLTGIVRDKTYEKVLRVAGEESERCLLHVIDRHCERMKETGRRLWAEPAIRSYWRKRVRWGPGARDSLWFSVGDLLRGMLSGRGLDRTRKQRARVFQDARVTAWLRDATERRSFSSRVSKALRRAPIFLDPCGRPLSMAGLGDPKKRVRYTLEPFPVPVKRPVIWCVAEEETYWLKRRFAGRLERVTARTFGLK